MFETMKVLHLWALMFGACASFGNLYVLFAKGPQDLPAPGFVKKLQSLFRITALIAITTLFVTGAIMLAARYGFWVEGQAFQLKLAFATLVLCIVLFLNAMAFIGRPPPSYARYLHSVGALSLIFTTMLAVIAFG